MVRVAFWFDAPIEYSGGVNYIANLLYALSLVNDERIEPYVFLAADAPQAVCEQLGAHAAIVRTRLLERRTVPWLIHKVSHRVFGSMWLATRLMKRIGIDLVSHAWFVYKRAPFPVVGWIPDFQYLHLPEFFPGLDPETESRNVRRLITHCDLVVLSSRDALSDFERIAPPTAVSRGRVLHFVSQPFRSNTADDVVSPPDLERKYEYSGRFFFLPNQFWVHKNHMIVLRAVKLLRDRGMDVLVLCTGNAIDYRQQGTPYIDELRAYVEQNGLEAHVKLLGMIDYEDVLRMIRYSVAVLNPSRFEGWSSTVEEAKSSGKTVVLSRIGVHLEQDPEEARYFDPDDAEALAHILAELWESPADDSDREERARRALHRRTVAYGRAYLDLVTEAMNLAATRGRDGR